MLFPRRLVVSYNVSNGQELTGGDSSKSHCYQQVAHVRESQNRLRIITAKVLLCFRVEINYELKIWIGFRCGDLSASIARHRYVCGSSTGGIIMIYVLGIFQ